MVSGDWTNPGDECVIICCTVHGKLGQRKRSSMIRQRSSPLIIKFASSGSKYCGAPRPGTSRTRYGQVILSFLGVTIFGLQLSSLMIGLVAMTEENSKWNYTVQNYTLKQKGVISGMMGYGNGIGNFFLGFLAHKFGVIKLLPLASGFFSGFMACMLPFVAIYIGFEGACVITLLQGLGLSFVYPCVYAHMSKWVVPREHGKFSWVWSGHQVGHLLMMASSGSLHFSPGGWPSVFYLPGLIGILWGAAFLIWGASSPAVHPSISDDEREFIESNIASAPSEKMKGTQVPWCSILKSVPIWALLIVQMCDLWVAESLMSPIFLRGACHLTIHEIGKYTAIAYSLNIALGIICALLAHHVTDDLSLNFSRKFWTAVGMYGGAISLGFLLIFAKRCHLAVLFFETRLVLNAATHPGYMSTILSIAPNLAATIAATFNSITSFVSSTGPLLSGMVVRDEHLIEEWMVVITTAVTVLTCGCTVFLFFGSNEPQRWDSPETMPRRESSILVTKVYKYKDYLIRIEAKAKDLQALERHRGWSNFPEWRCVAATISLTDDPS